VLLQSVTVVTASAQSAPRRAARGLQIGRFAARGVWAPRRAIPDHDPIMLNRAMAASQFSVRDNAMTLPVACGGCPGKESRRAAPALPRTPSPDGCDPHRECRCC
jgi:hypothetical protein